MSEYKFDPTDLVKNLPDRLAFLMNADKVAHELIERARVALELVEKLQPMVDKLEDTMKALGDIDIEEMLQRFDRLEEAALNIERGTLKVEASLDALPNRLQNRMQKELRKYI